MAWHKIGSVLALDMPRAVMENLLVYKGAGLGPMCTLDMPVPSGVAISPEAFVHDFENKSRWASDLKQEPGLMLASQTIFEIFEILDKGFRSSNAFPFVPVGKGLTAMFQWVLDVLRKEGSYKAILIWENNCFNGQLGALSGWNHAISKGDYYDPRYLTLIHRLSDIERESLLALRSMLPTLTLTDDWKKDYYAYTRHLIKLSESFNHLDDKKQIMSGINCMTICSSSHGVNGGTPPLNRLFGDWLCARCLDTFIFLTTEGRTLIRPACGSLH